MLARKVVARLAYRASSLMNRSELRSYLSNPIRQNSMYDNDLVRTKSKVFDQAIGVNYSYNSSFTLSELQRPGDKSSHIKNSLRKIFSYR